MSHPSLRQARQLSGLALYSHKNNTLVANPKDLNTLAIYANNVKHHKKSSLTPNCTQTKNYMNKQVVFIGCGDIATRAALQLQREGIKVLGVRRNTDVLPDGLPSYAANVLEPSSLGFLNQTDATTIVYSLAAARFSEEAYRDAYISGLRNTINACDFNKITRLIFVSSTAVYHQNDGSKVDETSTTTPQRFNGKTMLQAESHALATGVGTVLRLSGIYGPGRRRLIDRVRTGQCTAEASATYSNRIHVDDCAGVIAHLIKQDALPEIVLGSDSLPATSVEVETFIASTLGIEKQYADSTNESSAKGTKRIAGSKRCDNTLLLNTGYRFIHPDYRSGYHQLITTSPA